MDRAGVKAGVRCGDWCAGGECRGTPHPGAGRRLPGECPPLAEDRKDIICHLYRINLSVVS